MTFDDVVLEAFTLGDKIRVAGFAPEYLVGVARGGWIPVRLLSTALSVKRLLSIGLAYADSERTRLEPYSLPAPFPTDSRLLIVEDCLESGRSLAVARDIFSRNGNMVKNGEPVYHTANYLCS